MNLMIRSPYLLFGLVLLCGCDGGRGSVLDVPDIERPPISLERPNDGVRSGTTQTPEDDHDQESSQGSSGTTTTRTLECSGTYTCRESGTAQPTSVSLTREGGHCKFQSFTLETDGRLTSGDKEVGRWSSSTSLLTITQDGRTLVCTKS